MIENPADIVSQLLIRVQDSIDALRAEVGQFKRENEVWHEETRGLIRKQRRDAAGMMVIMQATVSDFDERVSAVEERITALDARTR
jgi:hypothetical protein